VKATEALHERGQSLWLDNITRSMLDDGTIQRYINSYSVTGLTSNPSIFDKAIGSGDYDDAGHYRGNRVPNRDPGARRTAPVAAIVCAVRVSRLRRRR
jgi:transaldolase